MLFCCLFKQKTAYEMRISDWSSDVCSSDLSCVVCNLHLAQSSLRNCTHCHPHNKTAAISHPCRDLTQNCCTHIDVHVHKTHALHFVLHILATFTPSLPTSTNQQDRKSTRLNSGH